MHLVRELFSTVMNLFRRYTIPFKIRRIFFLLCVCGRTHNKDPYLPGMSVLPSAKNKGVMNFKLTRDQKSVVPNQQQNCLDSLSREKSRSSLFLSASSMEPYVTSAMGAPMRRPSMSPRTSPKQLPAKRTQRLTRSCIPQSLLNIDGSRQQDERNISGPWHETSFSLICSSCSLLECPKLKPES
jgi:hypothetical protein